MVDVERIRSEYDLRQVVSQDIKLRKESVRELSGSCPKCGGDDRFHVNAERFMCRSCHPEWGDVIEYVSWMREIDFLPAVEFLGESEYSTGIYEEVPVTRQADFEEWQAGAQKFVDRTIEFMQDAQTSEAASYLLGRGIFPRTWEAFGLGFAPRVYLPNSEETAPAVSIPWYRQNSLIGIRFRFLEEQNGYTKTAYAGSNFSGTLYGGHALKSREDLILCEGELNAISIWQETDGFDVLSIGSETTAVTPAMQRHLSGRWQSIYLWADKGERAENLASQFPGAQVIESEQDANELLQVGELREVVEKQTEKK